MDTNREMAYIVAYYLSRFNDEALSNLGFKTNKEAFSYIGEKLDIPANYIKFRRDEFDVVHPHRQGWHKKSLSQRTIKTIEAFEEQDEYTLRSIVKDILHKNSQAAFQEEYKDVFSIFPAEKETGKVKKKAKYTSRNITGRKAEEYFIDWHNQNKNHFLPNPIIRDVRDHGCGYDFEIENDQEKYAIEIKGMSLQDGGILFTQKEWETAQKLRDKYILVIISDIENDNHKIQIIKNPYEKFNPRKNFQIVVQVNWSLSAKEIKEKTSL